MSSLAGISDLLAPDGTFIHARAAERTKFCSAYNRPAPEAVTSAHADVEPTGAAARGRPARSGPGIDDDRPGFDDRRAQNQHLRVVFRFDAAKADDAPPLNSGFILSTRIENTRHMATINFDERSMGFIWFFSFLVWFSRVKELYRQCPLPGASAINCCYPALISF